MWKNKKKYFAQSDRKSHFLNFVEITILFHFLFSLLNYFLIPFIFFCFRLLCLKVFFLFLDREG